MTVVVDTNAVLVANRQHDDVSDDCVVACALRLQGIMREGRIALDQRFLILQEYQNKTRPAHGRGPGDAFVKWALQNNANPARCDQVAITEHPGRGYTEFPEDARLAAFDVPDRKFVAVAAAHRNRPPILQATDSKWLDWEGPLRDHGVTVEFLCPNDIRRFHESKFGV